jgi:hypothetical protein
MKASASGTLLALTLLERNSIVYLIHALHIA